MLHLEQIDQILKDAHYVLDHEGSLGPLIAPIVHDMATHVLSLLSDLRQMEAMVRRTQADDSDPVRLRAALGAVANTLSIQLSSPVDEDRRVMQRLTVLVNAAIDGADVRDQAVVQQIAAGKWVPK